MDTKKGNEPISAIGIFDKTLGRTVYMCDPRKATNCKRTGCFWKNANYGFTYGCFCTSKKEQAIDSYDDLKSLLEEHSIALKKEANREIPKAQIVLYSKGNPYEGDFHCSACNAIIEREYLADHNLYYCYHCGRKFSNSWIILEEKNE